MVVVPTAGGSPNMFAVDEGGPLLLVAEAFGMFSGSLLGFILVMMIG